MARCSTCNLEVGADHRGLFCPRCGNPLLAAGPSRHTSRTTQELAVDDAAAPAPPTTAPGADPLPPPASSSSSSPPAPGPTTIAPAAPQRLCPNPACGATNAPDATECAYCFTSLAASTGAAPFVLRFPWGDVELDQRLRIGRSPEYATLPWPLASEFLSRRHAELWVEGGRAYVVDVGSHNGTYRNGSRLGSTPVEVLDGDQLEFGSAEVRAVVGRRSG